MNEIERILLECRYILSVDKTYDEIAKHLYVSEETVYHDLNTKLLNLDGLLYEKVQKRLKNVIINK